MENQELDTVVWFGGEVKALNDSGRVGGYLVRFSTANDPDLAGDYFTPDTDFGPIKSSPILYHHGMDSTLKGTRLGLGELKTDDVGVWLEGQLELRDDYEKAIFQMAKAGKLGWSSGTASHLVTRKSVGNATEILSWPLGLDASLTPTPCEPRTEAIPLKSIDPPQLDALKAIDLQKHIDDVWRAFEKAHSGWVCATYDEYVIAGVGHDKYYRIPYIGTGENIEFSPMTEWVQVEEKREWVEAKSIYLNRLAELKSSEAESTEAPGMDAVADAEAKSAAAEPTNNTADEATEQPLTMENTNPQEQAQPEVPATEQPEVKADLTDRLVISRAEYDQFQALQVQAKAFSQEPAKVVKAAHEMGANLNMKTGLGDSEAKALAHWVRTGDMGAVDSSMKAHTGGALAGITIKASNDTDMNVGTAADGGNAVPTGHYQNIVARRDEMMLAGRLGVQEIPGVGTTVNVPVDAEDDGEFVATNEAAANDRDAPALGSVAMTLAKYTKRVDLSDELMQDEDSRLMAFLENFISRGMAKTHNDLLITEVETNGTNLKTFAGAAAIAAGEIQDITYNDNLAYYLDDSNSVAWVTRPSTYGAITSIQGNDFIYDDTPQGSSAARVGAKGLLAKYPVHFSNKVETLATANKSILFGNWFYVGVRNAPEFTVLRDPYSAASTGQVRLHYYFRTVYKVLQAEAIGYGTQA